MNKANTETINLIKIQEARLKITDALINEGDFRKLQSQKKSNEIEFEFKDFQDAWNKHPEVHQAFNWLELVKFYNEFHKELKK